MPKKIYFKLFVSIILVLWIIYFMQTSVIPFRIKNAQKYKEGFTPKIHSMYRPYVRDIEQKYESFVNNYGSDVVMNKLKKWNIY
jgi:hypothetical protein